MCTLLSVMSKNGSSLSGGCIISDCENSQPTKKKLSSTLCTVESESATTRKVVDDIHGQYSYQLLALRMAIYLTQINCWH